MRWKIPTAYLVAVVAAAVVRISLLGLPPAFITDVYYYNAQAVGYLLRGIDPYGAAYAAPAALATADASNVFAYLPGVFAFIAPAGAFWDARLGLVICDFVVATSLFFLGDTRRWLYPAAYLLFPPTVLFSTWFLNDTLPAMAFLSLAVVFELREKSKTAALFWGTAAAASQEMWFVLPLFAYYSLRRRRYREVLIALVSAAVILAPFLLWNPSAFVYDSVLFQFTRVGVPFLSSGPFGLNVNPSLEGILLSLGVSVPIVVRGALVGAAFLLAVRLTGKKLSSLMLACTAFTSAALLLLAGEFFWSYLELPFLTFLAWLALARAEKAKAAPDAFNA